MTGRLVDMSDLRPTLRAQLSDAMRARDRARTDALRIAIAALDNAESVPTEVRAGAVEESLVGVGAAEVARRLLTDREQLAIVADEATTMRTAATLYESADPARAEALLTGAECLESLLAGRNPS